MNTTWRPVPPTQLPSLRTHMIDCMRSPLVRQSAAIAIATGGGTLIPPGCTTPEQAATLLHQDEELRLRGARLYSVTEEMTDVAVILGGTLPTWTVTREDIPYPSGLMIFDKPFNHYVSDRSGLTISIVGASWGRCEFGDPDQVWLTFWSAVDVEGAAVLSSQVNDIPLGQSREIERLLGEVRWDNEALLTLGSDTVQVPNTTGRPREIDPACHVAEDTVAPWVQTVRAVWLLLRHGGRDRSVAAVSGEHLSRRARQTMRRDGVEPFPVTVVTLNRTPRTRAGAGPVGGHTVTVRSLVTGHPRWQPYPTRGTIEPIWIEPYVRGPDGAPFAQKKEKVYRLDRPPGGRPPVNGE